MGSRDEQSIQPTPTDHIWVQHGRCEVRSRYLVPPTFVIRRSKMLVTGNTGRGK